MGGFRHEKILVKWQGSVESAADDSGATPARAETIVEGDDLVVTLGGDWRITRALPAWRKVRGNRRPRAVRMRVEGLERWDSSLVRFVYEVQDWCRAAKAPCDTTALPETVRRLVEQLAQAQEKRVPADHAQNFLASGGPGRDRPGAADPRLLRTLSANAP